MTTMVVVGRLVRMMMMMRMRFALVRHFTDDFCNFRNIQDLKFLISRVFKLCSELARQTVKKLRTRKTRKSQFVKVQGEACVLLKSKLKHSYKNHENDQTHFGNDLIHWPIS